MKLILLSNTRDNPNPLIKEKINQKFINIKKIAYIPTSKDTKRKYFKEFQKYFHEYELTYFGLCDGEWNESFIEEIGNSDAVFISGGNTYNLLYHIKLRGLNKVIKDFAQTKWVCGVSAGGIVMTPSVETSIAPNEFGLNDLSALNLVDFYFYPHFEADKEWSEKLKSFVGKHKGEKIYAVNDKSAIIVEDGEVEMIGEVIEL